MSVCVGGVGDRGMLIGDLHDYVRYYLARLLMISVNFQHHRKCISKHDWQRYF